MQSDSDAMFTICDCNDVIVEHHEEIIITFPITTFPDMLKRMHSTSQTTHAAALVQAVEVDV